MLSANLPLRLLSASSETPAPVAVAGQKGLTEALTRGALLLRLEASAGGNWLKWNNVCAPFTY